MKNCEESLSCGECTAAAECVWCMNSQTCSPFGNDSSWSPSCPLTGYRDCCFLHSTCSECNKDPMCVYCGQDDTFFCVANESSSSCKEKPKCFADFNRPFAGAFIFGTFMSIGGIYGIISFILLIWFSIDRYRKNIAHNDLDKLYREQKRLSKSLRQMDSTKDKYTSIASLINIDNEI